MTPDDIPEREQLNAEETAAILRMHFRLLARAADKASAAVEAFGRLAKDAIEESPS